jgi:hypothetical protein
VTAGKFKEPFGLERLQLSPNNRLIELGLPSDLVPADGKDHANESANIS